MVALVAKKYLALLAMVSTALLLFPFDRKVHNFLLPFSDSWFGIFYAHLTDSLGNGGFLMALGIFIGVLFLWKKRDSILPFISCVFLSMAAVGLFCQVLKIVIGRPRPGMMLPLYVFQPFSLGSDFQSCPSGHAAATFAVFWCLVRFVPRFRALWIIFAITISLGRVIGQAHFLSDVMLGGALGILLSEFIFTRYKAVFKGLKGLIKRLHFGF